METKKQKRIGVYGIIVKDGKIALIRKAKGGYKGKLDLPGGGMDHAETPLETLSRELQEEAEVTVTKAELFDVTSTNVVWETPLNYIEDLHHIGILYKVEIKEDKVKTDPDGLDSEGCDWYPVKELKEEELSPFAKYVVERL